MHLEPVRLIADRFADLTVGLNAIVAQIPRDSGDDAPAPVFIADETRNDAVARGLLPATFPAWVVSAERVEQLDGQVTTVTADAQITILCRYAEEAAVTRQANVASSYVLRAGLWVLRNFFDDRLTASAARTRNDIYLESILSLSAAPVWAPNEDAVVTGAVRATIQLRDLLIFAP